MHVLKSQGLCTPESVLKFRLQHQRIKAVATVQLGNQQTPSWCVCFLLSIVKQQNDELLSELSTSNCMQHVCSAGKKKIIWIITKFLSIIFAERQSVSAMPIPVWDTVQHWQTDWSFLILHWHKIQNVQTAMHTEQNAKFQLYVGSKVATKPGSKHNKLRPKGFLP